MRVIVLEGVNAAGKSSVGLFLKKVLLDRGHPCVLADPAGCGPIGKLLRELIVQPSFLANADLHAVLFAALRAEGAEKLLEDTRSNPSSTLVLERWSLAISSYGAADGARTNLISELRGFLQSILEVDTTVLLDINGETAHGRIATISNHNQFELRGQRYLDDVARYYRSFAEKETDTNVVDASSDLKTTCERVRKLLALKWSDFDRNFAA
jgi:dTMP kinase